MLFRSPAAWERAIANVRGVAEGRENMLPALIDAVHANATLGELSDAMRAAWGEHREAITL